jgi:DNA-binding transcriptional ArsR family regulator
MTTSLRQFKADIFQALAHPTRIAIVEALRDGEMAAGRLIESLKLEQANASQHLAILRSKMVVLSRKSGNQMLYSLRDPVLIEVLDSLKRYFFSQLASTRDMIEEIEQASVKESSSK